MQLSESMDPLKLAPTVLSDVRIVMASPLCCTNAVIETPPESKSPRTEALPLHEPLSLRVIDPLPEEPFPGGGWMVSSLSLLSLHPMEKQHVKNKTTTGKLRKIYLPIPSIPESLQRSC